MLSRSDQTVQQIYSKSPPAILGCPRCVVAPSLVNLSVSKATNSKTFKSSSRIGVIGINGYSLEQKESPSHHNFLSSFIVLIFPTLPALHFLTVVPWLEICGLRSCTYSPWANTHTHSRVINRLPYYCNVYEANGEYIPPQAIQ